MINPTKKISFFFSLILFFFCNILIAQKAVTPLVQDKLIASKSTVLSGYLASILESSYENRIMAQDFDRLIAPFRHRTEVELWQSEFWGKWFTSAVEAYQYRPDPKLKTVLDSAVAGLLSTQTPDGYIGNYSEASRLDQWDIWGQKYCMLGLLAYYDLTKDKNSLQAARKMADYLINELARQKSLIVTKGNYHGMAATSVLEPITMLYTRTGVKKYLSFAEEIVREWELPIGPQLIARADVAVGKRFPYPPAGEWLKQGQKAYEMMSCYEGLLNLYKITGKKGYLQAVEKTWQSILETEINIVGSGSSSECWYGGKHQQQHVAKYSNETCVSTTWISLSLQLLKLTGDLKYADAVERTYYNALIGAMTPDGSAWAMYSPLTGIRTKGIGQCGMKLDCCNANGPRGLFKFPLTMVMADKSGIRVNFFNAGIYQVKTPNGEVAELNQKTSYPLSGNISIELKLKKEQTFTIAIRIPSWSHKNIVKVNGRLIPNIKEGKYLLIDRKWNSNDNIEIELDMRGRIEKIDGEPSYLSIVRGPIVLARDLRMTGKIDIDEIITPVMTEDGYVPLEFVQPSDSSVSMSFSIACLAGSWRIGEEAKPIKLTFINYSSAGNTFSELSRYRVWFPQLLDTDRGGYVVQ